MQPQTIKSLLLSGICISPFLFTTVMANTSFIPVVTRSIVIFTNYENNLLSSLKSGKRTEVEKLLLNDFEERTATKPAIPIPRQEWLANQLNQTKTIRSINLDQMAVRGMGNVMVVSFKETINEPQTKSYFIVDIWKGNAMQWKLAARYSSTSN